ncbi:MAG: VWA domain-containing protein [Chloroflexota bacterium]
MIFRFESPGFLLLLVGVALLALRHLWSRRNGKPAAVRYSNTRLLASLTPSWRVRFRPLLSAMRLGTLSLMVIALARPQTGQGFEIVTGQGIDIALALDISGSMASLDFQPANRLEAAKQVIQEFIDQREFDRIGLVVFAAEAFNQSPLTTDHNVLKRMLEQIELAPDLGIQDGTAIGLGLANAANMLKDSDAESKVVILLTDGVNNSGQIDPITAAQAAAALGVRIYTIGAAREGQVPVPMQDIFGREQIVYQDSILDEDTLRRIADMTGGLYFRAEDTAGLQQIYDNINELEKSEISVTNFTQYEELAGYLLVPSLGFVLLEMFLRQTVFRKIP